MVSKLDPRKYYWQPEESWDLQEYQARDDLKAAIGGVLTVLGVNLDNENYRETPKRVANFWLEKFPDYFSFSNQLYDIASKSFPSDYDGIVSQTGIRAHGLCPHHLLPVEYEIGLAYIPVGSKAIGLSKPTRLAQLIGGQPLLQEDATKYIADAIQDITGTDHVAVIAKGIHMCMVARGVESHGTPTVTSDLRGDFREDPIVRQEFMFLINQGGSK